MGSSGTFGVGLRSEGAQLCASVLGRRDSDSYLNYQTGEPKTLAGGTSKTAEWLGPVFWTYARPGSVAPQNLLQSQISRSINQSFLELFAFNFPTLAPFLLSLSRTQPVEYDNTQEVLS